MRPEFEWTHKPIREWSCFIPKCKARTKDWISEGWWVTGFTTNDYFEFKNRPELRTREQKTLPRETYEETDFARDELVRNGVIEESRWTCAYICPAHKSEAIAKLANAANRAEHARLHANYKRGESSAVGSVGGAQ